MCNGTVNVNTNRHIIVCFDQDLRTRESVRLDVWDFECISGQVPNLRFSGPSISVVSLPFSAVLADVRGFIVIVEAAGAAIIELCLITAAGDSCFLLITAA